ncbi:uncharacterized protein LOC111946335 [Oryzias latipes]|uniref:uncharacterized protein LOC111946335 n=1 Tax=Oryzias latipes TaxID=8090 RepID=UPI000CE172F6|nr:uncharacterized protein LOC111946335 [Oryzias latipes]
MHGARAAAGPRRQGGAPLWGDLLLDAVQGGVHGFADHLLLDSSSCSRKRGDEDASPTGVTGTRWWSLRGRGLWISVGFVVTATLSCENSCLTSNSGWNRFPASPATDRNGSNEPQATFFSEVWDQERGSDPGWRKESRIRPA